MSNTLERFDAVIVGAGFSGLLCAGYLKRAGIKNILVLEMTPTVGGVWAKDGVGSYPGAACDVPSYAYLPLLDETGFIPTKKYVTQPEIYAYAQMMTEHLGIKECLRLSRKVTEAVFADEVAHLWQVTTVDSETGEDPQTITCRHFVAANGPLSSPRLPEFSGMETFAGESFHTAQWDKGADLSGKRVGVIGTGASAAQVITTVVDEVKSLHVFQRTPTWALPREDEATPREIREKFRAGGFGELLRRAMGKGEYPPGEQFIDFDMLHDDKQNAAICEELAKGIRDVVHDSKIAELLIPDYPFWCKRVLFIDDYYTTFNKQNVTLVHDDGGVVGVDKSGLKIARGEHFDLDVIIYATGFDSNFIPFPIYGRNGTSLATKFGANQTNRFQMTRPESLWGIHVEDMPNFYMMAGPQSLNPVTNVTLLCEQQAKYIAELISSMNQTGYSVVEPKSDAVSSWTELCNSSSRNKVWLRCNNWYTKTTKTDQEKGRERSAGMWMETYEDYLSYVLHGRAGTQEELLLFS